MLFGLSLVKIYFNFAFTGLFIIFIYLGAFLSLFSVLGSYFFDLSFFIGPLGFYSNYDFKFLYLRSSPKGISLSSALI